LDSLHDPYLFIDMQKAVDRIKQAKESDEKVFIF
jgi:single-stranded DNA-specific DHH superfamily exonuclease